MELLRTIADVLALLVGGILLAVVLALMTACTVAVGMRLRRLIRRSRNNGDNGREV